MPYINAYCQLYKHGKFHSNRSTGSIDWSLICKTDQFKKSIFSTFDLLLEICETWSSTKKQGQLKIPGRETRLFVWKNCQLYKHGKFHSNQSTGSIDWSLICKTDQFRKINIPVIWTISYWPIALKFYGHVWDTVFIKTCNDLFNLTFI